MNATDTKTVCAYYEEDIARMKAAIEKTKAECTHVYADGKSAVGFHQVCLDAGPIQEVQACQVCSSWISD